VPAEPSSWIPSGLTVLGYAEPLRPAETPHLLAYLATITDPRARAGHRHPLAAIPTLAAAAVLAGARSVAAIAEWAADAPQPVRAALGTRRDPLTGRWAVPTETTIRRTLARLDAEALAAAIGGWLADRERPSQRRRAVAVDGKTLRGARRDGRPAHLLAAPTLPGTTSPCWTAPATAATAASSCAVSKPSPCTTSGSRTPARSSRSPAEPATLAPDGGGP
jgi:DDE_Tnp_1-associated